MKPTFLISYEKEGWHVLRWDRTSVAQRFVQAGEGEQAALRAALGELGNLRQAVCLGLPSSMIFSAEIDCVGLPRKQRRNVMLYRLEEQLPHDIELMTADFLHIVDGKTLGLAVETAQVKQVIQRLEDAGIGVRSICPTALLAVWQALRESPACDYAIVAWCGTVDVFRMVGGQPAAWYTLQPDTEEIGRCIRMDRAARPVGDDKAKVILIAAKEDVPSGLDDWSDIEILADRPDLPSQASAGAQRHMAGNDGTWADFRRDGLSSSGIWGRFDKALKTAVVLILLVPLLFSAAFFYRAWRYEQVVNDNEISKQSLYRELFPNTKVSSAVKRRLESELQRAVGLSGDTEAFPRQANALNTMRRMAGSLPENARFLILDMWVNPEGVSIEGQTRSHGEAELIMNSLSGGGFAMDAPRTERLASGDVSFTLSGRLESEEAKVPRPATKSAGSASTPPKDAAPKAAQDVREVKAYKPPSENDALDEEAAEEADAEAEEEEADEEAVEPEPEEDQEDTLQDEPQDTSPKPGTNSGKELPAIPVRTSPASRPGK